MAVVNDLVVGAWRNGLDQSRTGEVVAQMLKKEAQGFTLYPTESTVVELTKLLDSYDQFSEEMLTATTWPEAMAPILELQDEKPKTTKKRGA